MFVISKGRVPTSRCCGNESVDASMPLLPLRGNPRKAIGQVDEAYFEVRKPEESAVPKCDPEHA